MTVFGDEMQEGAGDFQDGKEKKGVTSPVTAFPPDPLRG